MSGGMPELGSCISLISKADIRYEGRLFTVDPQECTIALAGVQSFGTEDRETQHPIAPQNQIYEYILFRGSDIKDIRVINNVPVPNDPAIMQMHLPSSAGSGGGGGVGGVAPPMMAGAGAPFSSQPPNFQMPQMLPPPPHMGMPGLMPQFGAPGGPMAPGANLLGAPGSGPVMAKDQMKELLGGGDAAKENKPPHDVQVGGGGGHQRSRDTTPASLARKSPTSDMGVQTSGGDIRKQHQQQQNRNRRDNGHQGGGGQQGSGGQQDSRPSYRGNRPPQGTFGGGGGSGERAASKSKTVFKFDNDYDFEQAYSKFEELRSQLSKLKVSGGASNDAKPAQANGEAERDVESDVEAEDRGGSGAGGDQHGDDKTKSFFDNISCAAVERQKGKSHRTDWRQERKLNTETFGVVLRRRGNYRGRGGYYRGGGAQFQRRDAEFHRQGGGGGQRNDNRRGPGGGGQRSGGGGGSGDQQRDHQPKQQQQQTTTQSTAAK